MFYYYYYYYGLVVVWGWLCGTTTLTTVAATDDKVEPCGTKPRPRSERWVEQVRLQHLAAARGRRNPHHDGRVLYPYKYQDLCQQCIEIDVHFHLVLADIGINQHKPSDYLNELRIRKNTCGTNNHPSFLYYT